MLLCRFLCHLPETELDAKAPPAVFIVVPFLVNVVGQILQGANSVVLEPRKIIVVVDSGFRFPVPKRQLDTLPCHEFMLQLQEEKQSLE